MYWLIEHASVHLRSQQNYISTPLITHYTYKKIKGIFHHITCSEGTDGEKYSSTLSLTSTLDTGE